MSHFILCFQILSQLLSFQFGLHHIAAVYPSQLVHLLNIFLPPNLVSCLAIHYIYHFNLTPSESMHNSAKGNNFLIECIVYGGTACFLAVTKVSVLSTICLKNASGTHTVFGNQIKTHKCPKD